MLPLLALLVVCFAAQAFAWAWVASGLRRVREGEPDALAPEATSPLPVSVVVAAHDEEASVGALLDALAEQTHRPFEVVVVDDRSSDRTAEIVRARAQRFPVSLRLVQVRETDEPAAQHYLADPWTDEATVRLPPKKNALTRGIRAASHDRLALTDADCAPPPGWLAGLAREASAHPDAVLVGYGPLTGEGWLGRFCRYETTVTAALSVAGVGHGRAWHATGRNLSYPRSLWERLNGFHPHARSLSGDDDLFVQHARSHGAEVRYVLDPRTFVPSPAPPDARRFWRQKRRHASAGAHYRPGVLAALGALQVSSLALWIGAPLLALVWGNGWGWGLLGARLLLQRAALSRAWDALHARPDLRLWHPALDAAHAAYQLGALVLGALPTPRRW